jgi:type IV pilus assembly protein PilB
VSDRLAAVRARSLAAEQGLPFVELSRVALDPDAVRTVPFETLERVIALPFHIDDDGVLRVAFAAPSDATVGELSRLAGRPVQPVLAARDELTRVLADLARGGTLRDEDLFLEGELLAEAPAVRSVNDILRRAIVARASDVHMIPAADAVHVRLRIDGVVQEHSLLTTEEAGGAVQRLKVLGKLDVAERRRPQDGRFTIRTTAGRVVDIRVTLLPTVAGEGVVLRLLEKTRTAPSLTELGLEPAMQMQLERLVDRGVGALLVTGPTGSGKSTTLHGALADLARPDRTVITIEDPVEYELPGAYQIQVHQNAGVTYGSALRSALRGDPDVIMVGEIRDAETATLALGASLAGHFTLSTLHTNDAPGALSRLAEMGVERYVIAAGVSGIIAQRLARRLCLYCREPYETEGVAAFRAHGCRWCTGGHFGRVGIFELLTMDERLRQLVADGASHESIAGAALAAGMQSLWTDGMAKVEAGLISLEELHRVVPR